MTQAVDLYLRLSVDREGKDSLERQEADLRAWAEREGLTVRTVWKDLGKSGYKENVVRDEFDAAVRAVSAGEVQTLAVWKLDRLSRRGAGQVGLVLDAVEKAGGRVFFLKDSLDSTVPGHRMVIMVVSEQARAESANTSARVKNKIAADIAKGIPKAGLRPFGWEKDGMTVRESEAAHIRWAYSAILNEGLTLWAVAQEFNRRGIVTDSMSRKRRTRQDEEPRKVPAVWTTTTVRQLLLRPRNAGILIHEGAEMPVSRIEPIVDRADWEAVKGNVKPLEDRGPKPQYLLGGLMECACGARMHASKSVTSRKGRTPHSYGIYRCRLHGFDKSLGHSSIQRDLAEGVVRDAMVFHIGSGDVATPGFDRARLTALQARLTEIAEKEQRATEALVEGVGSASTLKGLLKALAAERQTVEADRDRLMSGTAVSEALATFMTELKALEIDGGLYSGELDEVVERGYAAWDALSMDNQRAIIRGGFRVWVERGGRGPERVKVERAGE